jgi:hypothetical protein
MKKFLSNLLAFFFIILLFNFVLFYLANEIYYKKYKFDQNKKFKSFVFADSHGSCLNNYGEILNICNFSSGYESYFDINRKLKYLIQNDYLIDTIYISVDDHMLSPRRSKNNNLDKSIYYSSSLEFENQFEYYFQRYVRYYLPILHSKFRFVLKKFLAAKFSSYVFNINFQVNQNAWVQLSEKDRIKSAQSSISVSFSFPSRSEELTKTFLEIINICKIRNIKLVGVKFPLSRNLIAAIGNTNYGADSILISNGFPVLDYKNYFEQHDEYFIDADHANASGGKILAEKLFNQY